MLGRKLDQNFISLKKRIGILLSFLILIGIIIYYFSSSRFRFSTPFKTLTQRAESLIPLSPAPQNKAILGLPHCEVKPFELIAPDTPQRKGFVIRAIQDPQYEGSFPEDHFLLEIFPSGTAQKPQIIHRFLSSYMEFDLRLVDLTGDGVEEVILISGEGRGTEVRKETLTVFQLQKVKLIPLLQTPFSGFYGINHWESVLSFPKNNRTGQTHLALTLNYDLSEMGVLDDPDLIPKEQYREYKWDSSMRRMVICARKLRSVGAERKWAEARRESLLRD